MADITITQIRAKYPQYKDLSDQQLADALHQKSYSDMPKQDFYDRIGFADLTSETAPADPRAPDATGGFEAQLLQAMGPTTAPVFNTSPMSSPRPMARPAPAATPGPSFDAPPARAPLPQELLQLMMGGPEGLPRLDPTTPPSPPVRPRGGDRMNFGMMGGASPEMDAWARREIQRQEAERATGIATPMQSQGNSNAPIDTGQKTQHGRELWQAPDGSTYSEKTITAQAKDGKWYNVPTVTKDGRILDPDVMSRIVESESFKPVDPVTGKPLDAFKTVQEAEAAARARSEGMTPVDGTDGFGRTPDELAALMMPQGPGPYGAPPAPPPAQPAPPAQPDPFAGESAGDLLKRRGQQFAQGAGEMAASSLEGTGALSQRAMRTPQSQEAAARMLQERAQTITDIEARLADPNLSDQERTFLSQNLADLQAGQAELTDIAAGKAKYNPGFAEKAKNVRDAFTETFGAPPNDPSFWGQLTQGAGSMAGFLGSTLAGGAMAGPAGGFVATAGIGATSNAGQVYTEAKQAGATEDDALAAAGWGALAGSSEVIPIGRAFKILPSGLRDRLAGTFFRKAGEIALNSTEEALQEYGQQVMNNLIAQKYYDPKRGWSDQATENAIIGAILGAGTGAIAVATNAETETPATSPKREPEPPKAGPAQPAPPPVDPLIAAMGGQPEQPAAPREAPVAPSAPKAETAPKPRADQEKPAAPSAPPDGGNFEIMDETETVDGESRATGRKVRVNLDTGEASIIDANEAAGLSPPPAGAPVPGTGPDNQPQPTDATMVGAKPKVVAGSARPGPERRFLSHEETIAIETDPQTFQYKGGADTEGVTNALQGVTKFDPNRAGQVVLFETKDGRTIVADGHQRTGLARRTAEAGQKDVGGMAAVIYREADGYTPEEVMSLAALKNIGEGSGTAVDAARILRMQNASTQELGLPPNSALVRNAEGLRRLKDDAFGMVVNGNATEQNGAIVGRVVDNKDAQLAILGLLTKLNPANAFQAESIARQAAQDVTTETQTSLFGDEEVASNLYLERAKILDNAVKSLRDESRLFKTLNDKIDAITAAGNVLAKDENARRLDAAGRMRDYLQSQANTKGPISEALSAAARDLKAGKPVGQATRRFLEAVTRSVEGDGGRGQETPSGGSVDKSPSQGRPEPVTPPADDLLAAMTGAPAPAPTSANDDLLGLMGAKPVKNPEPGAKAKAEAAVKAKQSKMGTTTPQADSGPLFDTQSDIEKGAPQTGEADLLADNVKALREKYDFRSKPGFDNLDNSKQFRELLDRISAATGFESRLKVATDWVRSEGKETGVEHIVALDADGRPVVVGKGRVDNVAFPEGMALAVKRGEISALTHNHPSSRGFSTADFTAMLGTLAGADVIATGHNGMVVRMTPGPAATEIIGKGYNSDEIQSFGMTLQFGANDMRFKIQNRYMTPVRTDDVAGNKREEARRDFLNQHWDTMYNAALDRLGVISYSGDALDLARKAQAENENLAIIDIDALIGEFADAFLHHARIRRSGLDIAEIERRVRDRGAEKAAADAGSKAGPGKDEPASGNGNGDGRVRGSDQVAPDDFEAALDDMFGAETPAKKSDLIPMSAPPKKGEAPRSSTEIAKDLGDLFSEPDSPAFKRWFGDSKVVDADGKPLVVYHGGTASDAFSTPAFFTEDRNGAQWYAEERGDGNMVAAYLSIQKPFTIANKNDAARLAKILRDGGLHPYFEDGPNGWVFELDEVSENSPYDGTNILDVAYVPSAVKALKQEGFDGFSAMDMLENGEIPVFVAFDPTQIKSVDNRGTFDPNDARILFEGKDLFSSEPDPNDPNGAKKASDKATIEAQQKQSKIRRANQTRIEDDLGSLFGAGRQGDLFSEGGINEEKYAKAVPLFTEAVRGIDVANAPRREVFVAMIRPLAAAGLNRDAVAKMRPYFERFLDDVDSGTIALDQEAQNAPGTSGDLERDSGDTNSSDRVGAANVPASGRGDGRGAGQGGATPDDGGQLRPGGERVPSGDAAPVGSGRDQEVQGSGRREEQPSDGGIGAAGGRPGEPRVSPDDSPAGVTRDLARNAPDLTDRAAAQRAADEKAKRGVKLADEQNVRDTLPLLKPEQQDDVVKIEKRFLKPDGHGMLITNGTGTGKTYSGGGVVKRFVQRGKENILIVAPSDGILDHWVQALSDLGISASKLGGTTDAGKGVVVTTYANAGMNKALARRSWDLVVGDEAHKLSQNAAGDATLALRTLRAITNRPQDLWQKSQMISAAEWDKLKGMKDGDAKTTLAHRLYAQQKADVEAFAKEERSKVLFLSATPFAYDKNVDYGDGYLFTYPDDGHVGNSRQSGQNLFMVQNFGYRIRYHKLTKPDANVDSGVFEREFHEKLRREGMLSGRHLDIEPDYERRFVQREDSQGSQIDGILEFIREQAFGDGPEKSVYSALMRDITKNFNYLRRMQLLEAIKARVSQSDIDKHLAMGRKVVIFHDFNIGGGFNPFRPGGVDGIADENAYEGYAALVAERPEAEGLNFEGYRPPVDELKAVYGDRAVIYNGTIPKKERAKALKDFNTDGSGVDIFIVQSAAGEAGISAHDITGTHQRALINLGMPTRPTTALQEEGRIRREGSVSDALFHYYTIGTTWERQAFAKKIAERSGTVENLALGNEARTIRDSFIEAYEDAAPWEPSDADGKGGKARDRSVARATPYEIAKTHYFGRTKTKGKRDQREGIDFYATPEPLGFKMVEWAGVRPYERSLEPSAGDAAIARYLPEHSERTIIEPSSDLLSRALLRAVGAKGINGTFENYHIVNKHHVIVMNPPFGSGGKTAIEHLAKATKHLRPGGRIVALIPTGPAADARFDKWWDSDESKGLVRSVEIALPTVAFEKASTSVTTKVVIFDKPQGEFEPMPAARADLRGAKSIGEFFDRLENLMVRDRPAPAREAADEILDEAELANPDLAKPTPITAPVAGGQEFTTAETIHGKTGDKLFVASAKARVSNDDWKATVAIAKRHGGWFSSFRGNGAIPGYQFKTEAARQSFLDDMQKPTTGLAEPADGFDEGQDQFAPEVQPVDNVRAAMPALRAELDRLNLKRVRLFFDEKNITDLPPGAQGAFLRNPHGGMAIVIGATLDPMKTVHHEVIHALRSMNLFTTEEWRALEIKAARSWVEKYDIAVRYPNLMPSEQIEEAIAEAFSEASSTNAAPSGSILVRAFNKIARLFKAMRGVFQGAGFNTAEDVFGRVLAGEISARNTGQASATSTTRLMQAARVPGRQARAHMASVLGGAPHIPDRRIWEELTRAGSPIWSRLREGLSAANDAVDKARIRLQDRFLPVLRAQEAVMRATGAPLPADHNAYITETTFSGKVGRHLFEIDEDYTKPIISLIAATKGGLTSDSVGEWLTARHAQERNARIASINPAMPDGGSGMTNAEAQQILADAAASPHAATLQEIGTLIDALRERTLKLREDAGLITHAEANLWRSQYKFYVPLKGFSETDLSESVLDVTGIGRRFNTRGAETKRALGRSSEAFNPLQAAFTQAQEVAIRAEKNRVGHALYNLAKDYPSPALWKVKTVAMKRFYNRTTGLVESRPEDPVSLFMDPNEMAVKIDGKEHRVVFLDPRMARAAGSVGADQMGWFLSMMSSAARYFSSINTMLDPEFLIRNAFRDMTAAQINIRNFGDADRNAIAKAMIKNWAKAFVGAYRGQLNKADTTWTRYYKEFDQSGAKVSFWKLDQPEAGKSDLDRRIRLAGGSKFGPASRYVRFSTRDNPVLGFIERTNLAVDNAIRLAAYVAARERGWEKGDAAALAKNLTVNFNRRGEWGSTINALYPFANASIQGTQILFRAMTSKRMAKYGLGMVALGVIMDMMNAGLSHEDDDGELAYDKIADWKNRTNLMVMLGPDADSAATVWLPYGYSLFPYLGQQASKVARGVKKPGDAMKDFASAMFGAFSPMTGEDFQATLTPTMLDPINEMAQNKDWLGRPIRPENAYADYGPDAYKFYAGASEASKQLADMMNQATGGNFAESGAIDVSPEYIDHMFGFMTGGAGRTVGRSIDLAAKLVTGKTDEIELRGVPVARSLVYDTGDWLDRDRYYRFKDEVKEAHASAKAYQEAKQRVPQHIAKIDRLYTDLLAAEKALRAIKKQGGGDQTRVIIGFNKRFLKAAGPQGE